MIPEPVVVIPAITAIEAEVHKAGWDQPPRLLMLSDVPQEEGVALACRELPLPVEALTYAPLRDCLAQIASMLMKEPPAVVRGCFLGLGESFAGLVVTAESWLRLESPESRAALPDRPFADIPGSIETRTVVAIDTAGRCYYVQRMRGEEPHATWTARGDRDYPSGHLVTALTLLTIVAAHFAPPGSHNLPPLIRPTQADVDAGVVLADLVDRMFAAHRGATTT